MLLPSDQLKFWALRHCSVSLHGSADQDTLNAGCQLANRYLFAAISHLGSTLVKQVSPQHVNYQRKKEKCVMLRLSRWFIGGSIAAANTSTMWYRAPSHDQAQRANYDMTTQFLEVNHFCLMALLFNLSYIFNLSFFYRPWHFSEHSSKHYHLCIY